MDMRGNGGQMKHELIKLKQEIKLAQRGYDLFELKQRSLQVTLRAAIKHSDKIRAEAAEAVNIAYDALEAACEDIGASNVENLRNELRQQADADCLSGMERTAHLPLAGTTASLDEASIAWHTAVKKLIRFIDAENELLALRLDLRKTSKRASALKNIRIPQNQARIKYIENKLEERERESIARLKRMKDARR